MSEVDISVEGLSKYYKLGTRREKYRALRDTIADAAKAPFRGMRGLLRPQTRQPASDDPDHIWALRNVSFEVKRGQVLGVIGRNGAGKSTLLKILSRITEPTEGRVCIRGQVGSLLEVGTGFHPELTGGENVYLNGAILGMRKAEIDRKFDEIVSFAEVERFINTAVKHYSSGMYLRLAFAVAAHLDPDILMVDEVLSVGDATFQRKCLGKMQSVGDVGRTVLFVSHDMTAISRLAATSMVIDAGEISFVGPTHEAIRIYASSSQNQGEDLDARTDRIGDGVVRMTSVQTLDAGGLTIGSVGSGDPLTIAIGYRTDLTTMKGEDLMLDMRFRDVMGHPIVTFSTRFANLQANMPLGRSGVLYCHVPSLALAEETYSIDLWLAYRRACADSVGRVAEIQVTAANYFGTGYAPVKRKHGAALIRHVWTADPEGQSGVDAEVALSAECSA